MSVSVSIIKVNDIIFWNTSRKRKILLLPSASLDAVGLQQAVSPTGRSRLSDGGLTQGQWRLCGRDGRPIAHQGRFESSGCQRHAGAHQLQPSLVPGQCVHTPRPLVAQAALGPAQSVSSTAQHLPGPVHLQRQHAQQETGLLRSRHRRTEHQLQTPVYRQTREWRWGLKLTLD